MKVCVTGGAGFIGSNIVKKLLHLNHDIIIVDNLSSGFKKNVPLSGVHFIEGDIRDSALIHKILQGVETIYHLAASVGNKRSIENPIIDADINAIGTLNILEAARKYQVKKIIISSSAGIFGELKTLPIKENHEIEPRTPYACSKLYAEKVALTYSALYGIEVVCLRYFNVYGPNQRYDAYGNVIPIFVFNMLRGEPLLIYGDGEQTRDFVNVHDVVQANIKAASTNHLSGVFNVASGTQVTINQLVSNLIAISDINPLIKFTSPRLGDVRHSLADISSAKKSLGYSPDINLYKGLQEYFEWAKAEFTESISVSA